MHAIYCKLAVVAIMLLCAAGCEEWKALMAQGASVDLDATFRNESSATVSVAPAGEELYRAFVLPPGVGRTVTYQPKADGTLRVEYTYESSHRVVAHEISGIEIVFTDLNTVPTGG